MKPIKSDLAPIFSVMDDAFDNFFGWTPAATNKRALLDVSPIVTDTSTGFQIEIPAPGMDKSNFNITMSAGVLTIEANVRGIDKMRSFYRSFKHSWTVGDVKQEQVSASYENGVLKVVIPKAADDKVSTITIK